MRGTNPPPRDREVFGEVTDYDEIRVRERVSNLNAANSVLVSTDTRIGEDTELVWIKHHNGDRDREIPLPPTDATTLITALLVELQHLFASDEYPKLDEEANRGLDIARSHVEDLSYRLQENETSEQEVEN